MNKKEILGLCEFLKLHGYENTDNIPKFIFGLQKENKQLKDNWNKLKEWLEKELGDRINPNKDNWLTGIYDAYRETIDKMQELQGSDSNE